MVKMASILVALVVGMLVPLQSLINARLGQMTGGPLFAALCSFAVGAIALAAPWAMMRPTLPAIAQVPWWAWTGGVIGAGFVFVGTLLVTRLGAAALICLFVLGQLLGSVLLDHFGILHARQPLEPMRLFGIVLVALGALLVVRPWRAS